MILKYRDFLKENKMIDSGTVIKLKIVDLDGEHITKCKISYGYGVGHDRKPIYYELEVLESDSEKYNVGSHFLLDFNFDGKENKFLFYPNMTGHGSYIENHYQAKINII